MMEWAVADGRTGDLPRSLRFAGPRAPVGDETPSPSQGQAELRRQFLEGMRGVATPVTVVTTDGPAGRHGATVSAFASLSADPPTVLVCLRSDSRIRATVLANRAFTVGVLAEDGAEIARRFSGECDATRHDRFAGLALRSFPGLAPGIPDASCFACTLVRAIDQHSHTIAIGKVLHVAPSGRLPLLYHGRSYGSFVRTTDPQGGP